MEYLELGNSPLFEDCVQVSNTNVDYLPLMHAELKRYVEMLRKRFPFADGKNDCYFSIKFFPHDFGQYGEVVIKYYETEESWDIVSFIEDHLPEYWNDEKVYSIEDVEKEN